MATGEDINITSEGKSVHFIREGPLSSGCGADGTLAITIEELNVIHRAMVSPVQKSGDAEVIGGQVMSGEISGNTIKAIFYSALSGVEYAAQHALSGDFVDVIAFGN